VRHAPPLLFATALAVSAVGCPCVDSAVNASPELRWWLFSNFGASRVCPEMLKRGVPLKLPALGGASVGRFFPQQCDVKVDDASQTMTLRANGTGYATFPFTRRVGFYIGLEIEYRPDFRMEESGVWVWGTFSRFVSQPDLRITGVENPVVNLATKTPAGDLATMFGQSLVAGELGKGFTVVHRDDGDDFAIGRLDPPDRPKRQFEPGKGRVLYASDLDGLFPQSRDYLGPFEVTSGDAALYFRSKPTGAIAYALVDRSVGEAWRRGYESAQPMAPPPGPLLAQGLLPPNDGELRFPVSPGSYYLVLENQAPAQPTPLGMPLPVPEQVTYVTYSASLGDK
jgi:hypothetical protein